MLSAQSLAGILLVALAFGIVLLKVRRAPLAATGFAFASMALLYHGLVEFLQVLFPGYNQWRDQVAQADLDSWLIVVGIALVSFAIGYVMTVGRWPAPPEPQWDLPSLRSMRWPIYVATAVVTGLALFFQVGARLEGLDTPSYWTTGIVITFAPVLQAIAVILLAQRVRTQRGLLVLLMLYMLVLTLAGSRLGIVLGLWTTAAVLARLGIRVRGHQILALGAMVLFLMVAISAARVVFGRAMLVEQAAVNRSGGFVTGIQEAGRDRSVREGVLQDFVYRADANSYNAMVGAELRAGADPVGIAPLLVDVVLMVPSFLNPAKLTDDPRFLNEEFIISLHYGMDATHDYTTGVFGMLQGMMGRGRWFLAAALAFGVLLGIADRILRTRMGPVSLPIAVGLLYSALYYESNLKIYFLSARTVIVIVAVGVVAAASARVARPLISRVIEPPSTE